MIIKEFVHRFFSIPQSGPQINEKTDSTESEKRHKQCFKGRKDLGPFLLSCDGRVIPLRKAYFLRDRH